MSLTLTYFEFDVSDVLIDDSGHSVTLEDFRIDI